VGRLFFRPLLSVLAGALLFAASFPNPLIPGGGEFLAWIALIPLFWLSRNVSLPSLFFWGGVYGFALSSSFNYWLHTFHPLAGITAGVIYLFSYALLLPLLGLAVRLLPRRGYILQWLIWMAYEYLKIQGFLGYPYGIMGYTQWRILPLIQIADLTGIWGISALLVFPQTLIAYLIDDVGIPFRRAAGSLRGKLLGEWPAAALFVLALAGSLVYGAFSPRDFSAAPAIRAVLVQHNADTWAGGLAAYGDNLAVLRRLTDEALEAVEAPDLVVWPETAFVPRIYWHSTYRTSTDYYALVKELLDYLKTKDVPFVIGNDDGRREVNPQGQWEEVDYNAALLLERGEILRVYRKMRLVPFTEHFPYQKELPLIYKLLENVDTHFWKAGTEPTVFSLEGTSRIDFSTPICFEDSFGYISRDFVRRGAQLLVNLSNDSWSGSLTAQMQHFSMAVFRAVENRRSLIRATASGQTCGIDPYGRIVAMAEPFTETFLALELPLAGESLSFYTRHGDYLGQLFVFFASIVLIGSLIRYILLRIKR
jgi:apolipoprotein N-acyltransferase